MNVKQISFYGIAILLTFILNVPLFAFSSSDTTDVWDTSYSPACSPTSSIKAIAIYATGPNPSFGASLPSWYDDIFTAADGSVEAYLEEVSDSQHTMDAAAYGQNGTTCFEASVDPPWWPFNNYSTWYTFVDDILTDADAIIDFSDFDSDNDDVVDFVFFNVSGYGGLHGTNFFISGDEFVTDDVSPVTGNAIKIKESNGMYQHIGNQNLDDDPALSIILHEYGHQLGLNYDLDHAGFTFYNHYSLGGFEVMATLGFEARPSPYSPWYRIYITEWITPTDITSNQTNHTLEDFSTTGDVARIPAGVGSPAYSNQAFLVSNHQRESHWEQTWPGDGVLIWHYNPNGSRSDRRRKTIDVEAAHGLWEWNFGPNPPQKTSTANSETGFDSLDIRGVYEGTRKGGPTYFFNPGGYEVFAPWSNPSSDAYRTSSPYAQNVFTDRAVIIKSQQGTDMIVDLLTDAEPAPPENLAITNPNEDGENVELAWDANTEPDLDDYAIYRGYQDDGSSPVNWNSSPSATTSNTSWTDPFVEIDRSASSSVHYRITASDDAGNESDYSNSVSTKSYQVPKPSAPELPEEIALRHNYPNPFNPHTEIRFDLPERAYVTLTIYNLLGEEVRALVDGMHEIGEHSVTWDGKDTRGHEVPSGVYLYRMQVEISSEVTLAFSDFGKMTLLR